MMIIPITRLRRVLHLYLLQLIPLIALIFGGAKCNAQRSAIRQTSIGPIKGKLVELPVDGVPHVEVYYGIPYANPPVGVNRFMPAKTQQNIKWKEMRDATEPRSVCIQNLPTDFLKSKDGGALKSMPANRYDFLVQYSKFLSHQSEDCLYMNVYIPQMKNKSAKSSALPLLVLAVADTFEWGASSAFDPSMLVAYGEFIVVTVNFRLGPFGFLSSGPNEGGPNVRGNYAVHDLVSAIEQIRSLATDLGADVHRITLLGAGSAASALVHVLMASTFSVSREEPKFARAILLSGSGLSPLAFSNSPRQYFYLFADILKCDTVRPDAKFKTFNELVNEDTVVQCIREQNIENLTKAQAKMPKPSFLSVWGLVADGIVVNKALLPHLTEHPKNYQRHDVMFGLTARPGYVLLSDQMSRNGVSELERKYMLRTLVRNLYKYHRREILESIINEYTDWNLPIMTSMSTRELLIDALSDCLYTAPAIQAAEIHANEKSKTWLYTFEPHEKDDLAFILGYPLLKHRSTKPADLIQHPYAKVNFSRADAELSEQMMRYVTSFARTGDPNSENNDVSRTLMPGDLASLYVNQRWVPFNRNRQFLQISENPKVGAFYRAQKLAFWNHLIPELNEEPISELRDNAQLENFQEKWGEHHALDDHQLQDTYIGEPYPYTGYFTSPPTLTPPLPPPPITPKLREIIDNRNKQKEIEQDGSEPTTESPKKSTEVGNVPQYLGITIAVGSCLLLLNVMICCAIQYQRSRAAKKKKSLVQSGGGSMTSQYHSYESHTNSPYINLNSPLSPYMPPPPPPPGLGGANGSTTPIPPPSGGMVDNLKSFAPPPETNHHNTHHSYHHHHHAATEQEPLLRGPGGGAISPMCPRHSRQFAQQQQLHQQQQQGGGGAPAATAAPPVLTHMTPHQSSITISQGSIEEIQV